MSRSSSYFYIVLKLANPTAEALEGGLNLDDLLDAADTYNTRFKGLKQLLIMKSESVRVHAILTLSELSGVSLKRSNLDFSSHVSVFSNYLLNQKKWSVYSRDYRRLLHIFREPLVCSREDVVGALETFGYSEEMANKATGSMQFVGPSDRAQYKWFLHVQQCLNSPPHLAFESQATVQPNTISEPLANNTPANTDVANVAVADSLQPPEPVTILPKKQTIYSAPAHLARQQYRQASLDPRPPKTDDSFAAALDAVDEPLEALREQSIREAELSRLAQMVVEDEVQAIIDQAEEEPEEQPVETPEQPVVSEVPFFDIAVTAVNTVPTSPLNEEQLMAVLHSMVLTQDIGDEQAIAHKKQTIEQIKQLIAPWATFG